MITTLVERNPDKLRYEITFNDGHVEWFMFLNDEVTRDAKRFENWIEGLIGMLQEKERLS